MLAKQGGSLYHFYSGIRDDLARTETHDLPHEVDMLFINSAILTGFVFTESMILYMFNETDQGVMLNFFLNL